MHSLPSPFPRKTPLGTVLDELCYCGQLRSEHADTIAYGHGECVASNCAKFTWKSHIRKSPRYRTAKCDSCAILVINNVVCHELGCPRAKKVGRL